MKNNKKKMKPGIKIVIVIGIVILGLFVMWFSLTGPVKMGNKENIEVEIKTGTSRSAIGNTLKEKKVIRSAFMFKVYTVIVPTDHLKAGTYLFNQNMSLREVVSELEKGSNYNPDLVVLTLKEGKRITDYAKLIADKTNNSYDSVINVFKDREYTKELINKYWFLTDKILDKNIYYPLEGYLFPDTYHFENKDVEVKEIIDKVLEETDNKLSEYRDELSKDPHYYMTMASVVELEGTNTTNRKMIVGIFKNRMSSGMNMGSDVTTYYALQKSMNQDLASSEFLVDNPYNTRSVNMIGKMPVGPICSSSLSSIDASLHPTDSDYLFFVADKHGNIYYTRTNAEHDKKVAEIKEKGDWIW
ncbi:MAG: endolytic transglycosylase MltG [Bacilli bacterium]|nr:endolytic transglycosylase MltG [Bacilli bacterium]